MPKRNIDKSSFRDASQVKPLLEAIRHKCTRAWRIMEVCGGQTHALAQYDIESLLPPEITLLHGPGCPVCVTPIETVDAALQIAHLPKVIFASFGDMMRVPGSSTDLLSARAHGCDIRMLYSPLDVLQLAVENPEKEVVFFAIGFETTAPLYARLIEAAETRKIKNLSLLTALFTVPAALRLLLEDPDCDIDGFLAAGHVCAVTGYEAYLPLAAHYKIAVSVTGFEPLDLLYGIYNCISSLEDDRYEVVNSYARIVTRQGNRSARNAVARCFEPATVYWRGLGAIDQSGLKLAAAYKQYDAIKRFGIELKEEKKPEICRNTAIMQGKITPFHCPEFGKGCTPSHPLGAAMVSGEGACAAYFRYKPHL